MNPIGLKYDPKLELTLDEFKSQLKLLAKGKCKQCLGRGFITVYGEVGKDADILSCDCVNRAVNKHLQKMRFEGQKN